MTISNIQESHLSPQKDMALEAEEEEGGGGGMKKNVLVHNVRTIPIVIQLVYIVYPWGDVLNSTYLQRYK